MTMPGHVLISCMKDEGPFILEFVAHHLVLGFERIVIASNDCRDGSDRLLDALARHGYIAHVRNILKPGDIPQHAGYDRIRASHDIDSAEWLMMLDADEFLHVSVGDHSVQALTALAAPDVDVIALNAMTFGSQTFGSHPEQQWRPGRVCALFPLRLMLKDKANIAVKSLTRNPGRFKGIHNHHMVGFRGPDAVRVMRADGSVYDLDREIPIWKQIRNLPLEHVSHDLAHYNHYAVKTRDSFRVRRDRGRGAVAETTPLNLRHDDAYFAARAKAAIPDDRIGIYAPAVQARMAEMLAHRAIFEQQADTEARYLELLAPYQGGAT